MGDILKNGEYMLACAFASLLSSIVVGYITANFAANLSLKIRKNIFTKVQDMAISEIKSFSTSSLVTRTTNDITASANVYGNGTSIDYKSSNNSSMGNY